jgi:hypothetical protein
LELLKLFKHLLNNTTSALKANESRLAAGVRKLQMVRLGLFCYFRLPCPSEAASDYRAASAALCATSAESLHLWRVQ